MLPVLNPNLVCFSPHSVGAADKLRIGYGAPSVAMSVLWITKEGKLSRKTASMSRCFIWKAPWCSAR